ncbi:MAG TPA: hypothetical protein VFD38_08755 [Myxococcaceae bacterium]|nr:hypothetical protein [Myxococcaceae bacterium]
MFRPIGAIAAAVVLLLTLVLSRARRSEPEERFACALNALDREQRQRHGELSARLVRSVRGRTELRDGYLFTVDESAMDWASLAEWARLERLCCPFFRVAVRARPRATAVELELGGAPGVKPFIVGELPVVLAGG